MAQNEIKIRERPDGRMVAVVVLPRGVRELPRPVARRQVEEALCAAQAEVDRVLDRAG